MLHLAPKEYSDCIERDVTGKDNGITGILGDRGNGSVVCETDKIKNGESGDEKKDRIIIRGNYGFGMGRMRRRAAGLRE